MFEKTKINEKEAGVGPFLKKKEKNRERYREREKLTKSLIKRGKQTDTEQLLKWKDSYING